VLGRVRCCTSRGIGIQGVRIGAALLRRGCLAWVPLLLLLMCLLDLGCAAEWRFGGGEGGLRGGGRWRGRDVLRVELLTVD